jgi:hypothetical protein
LILLNHTNQTFSHRSSGLQRKHFKRNARVLELLQ